MRLLLDTSIWGGAVAWLVERGNDVVWAGAWDSDPGDQEILRIAHQEQRVLVTRVIVKSGVRPSGGEPV